MTTSFQSFKVSDSGTLKPLVFLKYILLEFPICEHKGMWAFIIPTTCKGGSIFGNGDVYPSNNPSFLLLYRGNSSVICYSWMEFSRILTESLLYVPIVHLLLKLLIWINSCISHSKAWILSFVNMGTWGTHFLSVTMVTPLTPLNEIEWNFHRIYYIFPLCTSYFRLWSEPIWGFHISKNRFCHLWI